MANLSSMIPDSIRSKIDKWFENIEIASLKRLYEADEHRFKKITALYDEAEKNYLESRGEYLRAVRKQQDIAELPIVGEEVNQEDW